MRFALTMVITCLWLGLTLASESEASIRKPTQIPAQGLGSALQALAKDRGLQVLYVTEQINRHQTKGASGNLTSDEALTQLLSGTGLTYRYLGEHSVTIGPASSVPEAPSRESSSALNPLRLMQAGPAIQTGETTSSEEQPSTESSSTSPQPRGVEEIVVTAQKREERLHDVPMSIGVVTGAEIAQRGLVSTEDYLRGIPGVNPVTDQFGGAVVIRGLELTPAFQNFNSGSTTATYFGETATTSSAGIGGGSNVDIKLVDIERIEVLRGPQGTAFGSSSLGGAVRTIPVAPKLDRFEGKLAAGYSATAGTGGNGNNIQLVGNAPLISDKLAIRAVGYRYEDGGYYRNIAGSDPAFLSTTAIPYGAQAFATNEREVGSTKFIGARVAALLQATDNLQLTISYLKQETERNGFGFNNKTGAYDLAALQVAPQHVVRGQEHGLADTDIDLANAVLDYDVGWGNLLATYSFTESASTYAQPWSYFFPFPVSNLGVSEHRGRSGEIRLSTKLDGAWNVLVGLFMEDLEDGFVNDTRWFGDAATNIFGGPTRDPFLGLGIDQRDLTQKAAFGEVAWEFMPGLTLTGGVRAYDYDRTINSTSIGGFGGGTAVVVLPELNTDASDTSFRSNLSYKPNGNMLLYAGWAQGFRLGKPQRGLDPILCDRDSDGIVDGQDLTIAQTRIVDSDDVDSYEFGGKFTLLEGRVALSADVFRIDWNNAPVTVQFQGNPCLANFIANAGIARSEGIEWQANVGITNAFKVDLGGSWMRARLKEDAPGVGGRNGDPLPGSPEFNAKLGVQYEFDLGRYKSLFRFDSVYVGTFYGDLQESPSTKAGGYVKVDTSARVALTNLYVDLFVRNLTDEDDVTWHGGFAGYRLRPRTIGLQVGYEF